MKNESSIGKSRAQFINRLVTIVSNNRGLFCGVFGVLIFSSILYAILFPRYISETMLLVQQKQISAGGNTNHFNISENESFLSTQLSLLSSRVILSNTLSSLFPQFEPTEKAIEKLKSAISVKRLPLNNLILIKLCWNSKEDTKKLLSEFIQSYRKWHTTARANEISLVDDLLSKKIEAARKDLNKAENDLAQWKHRNEISSTNEKEDVNQLNPKIHYKDRLENIIGVKESAYFELIRERDKNKEFLTNEKYVAITEIYAPTKPKKSNTILKMVGYAFLSSLFMTMIIIYFYIGKDE